jgi:hypothetical protein
VTAARLPLPDSTIRGPLGLAQGFTRLSGSGPQNGLEFFAAIGSRFVYWNHRSRVGTVTLTTTIPILRALYSTVNKKVEVWMVDCKALLGTHEPLLLRV